MMRRAIALAFALLTAYAGLGGSVAFGQSEIVERGDYVQLDFKDADLTKVIDAISRMTNTNFIYDERVRGKVTIKSPMEMTREQAYDVFDSVLRVKGFTTVETPGGALKIIPIRDAKQDNIDTSRSDKAPQNTDRIVTRLIPLRYIEAKSITGTLQPLISKEGSIESYDPTNMIILTEAASNIRRIMAILEVIDVQTYEEELAIITIQHADAATVANQVSEILGVQTKGSSSGRGSSASSSTRSTSSRSRQTTTSGSGKALDRNRLRLITDTRTNSVIVLAPREQLSDVRTLISRLDVPVTGSGKIHVYYLQHADAEELSQTLASLVGRRSSGGGTTGRAGGGKPEDLRSTVAGLSGGISITADPATNSLVIQASKEGYNTIREVIAMLDVERPQVLVEALIMEVDVTDNESLGFGGLVRFINGSSSLGVAISPNTTSSGVPLGGGPAAVLGSGAGGMLSRFFRVSDGISFDSDGNPMGKGSIIDLLLKAAASDNGTNIISAPHILTMDNEQAEIRIGQNIPIITNRVQSAGGVSNASGNLATSVNVERQDIGVTLRVTPQITEGDSLRLEIYQEISAINKGLGESLGDADKVGVPLSNRQIENVVVVRDGETVVIGGLLSDEYQDEISKVPFLGDIPILGWAFKSTTRSLRKINLLVFLTPHIIRSPEDLEFETVRKREQFVNASQEGLEWSDRERAAEGKRQKAAAEAGEPYEAEGDNPVRIAVLDHEARYPTERLEEISDAKWTAREAKEAQRLAAENAPKFAVEALVVGTEEKAIDTLQAIIDAGFDGTVTSNASSGSTYFQLQVGPFETLQEAQRVAGLVQHIRKLDPSVVVLLPEDPNTP
jgi:general secretion pathway protein D